MKEHIVLIGMMGCGKSTLGRLLADRLGAPFLDLDEEIVRFEGRSIPELFAAFGEEGFRARETAALRRALVLPPQVIASGGGIVTREENIALMRPRALVIWLRRPLEDMIATVGQGTRPNLAGDKRERMRTLYARREELYRCAAHIVFDNAAPPEQSAEALARLPAVRSRLQ